MNWESARPFSSPSFFDDERNESCEHVTADHSLAYFVLCEDDSFGPLVRYAVCQPCHAAWQLEEAAKVRSCADCHKEVTQDQGYEWKWYDFYAQQGDEALFVCKLCWCEPAHKARLAKDKADFEEEVFRREEDDYDGGEVAFNENPPTAIEASDPRKGPHVVVTITMISSPTLCETQYFALTGLWWPDYLVMAFANMRGRGIYLDQTQISVDFKFNYVEVKS